MCRQLMWLRAWTFTIVDQVSQDMLSEESIFHFELFGENYHTDDLVGFAWSCGNKL